MRKAANLLRERVEHVATLMTMEQGKTLAEAKAEILAGADTIDWFAEEGAARLRPRDPGARRGRLPARRQGAGRPGRRVHAVELPDQPGRAQALGRARRRLLDHRQGARGDAGLAGRADPRVRRCRRAAPASINLVYGDPAEISSYLIPHPVIRKISFTGSTAVGKQLAALAGQHMKRATMELGGHAPVIVFDDADVDVAAKVMAASKFRNAGQVCISPTRFLVQEGVYNSFVEKFVDDTKRLKVGNGLETGMNMGALANPRRATRDGGQRRGREQARRQGPHRRPPHRQGGQFLRADRRHRAAERREGDERGAVRPAGGDQPVQDLRRRGRPKRTGCRSAWPPTRGPSRRRRRTRSPRRSRPA